MFEEFYKLTDGDISTCARTRALIGSESANGFFISRLVFDQPANGGNISLNVTFSADIDCPMREVI